jgi:tRNA-splicing ligase RtcB (3'-phosphate/5'-hydroxy nucleic acid ligase)
MEGADVSALSQKAVDRGLQLSTIGGGNHFIEIGYVDKVYDEEAAFSYGLYADKITILIHTGSRGFGHQVCTDYSSEMKKAAAKYKLHIPSAGLASVPIKSAEGKRYLGAMACAVNFAFCNRQWITDDVRKAFSNVFGGTDRDYGLDLVYDVAHNTARFEIIDNKKMLIHRKGATRALPAGHPENPEQVPLYRTPCADSGQHGNTILCYQG